MLGATEELIHDSGNGARVTILDVARATLELSAPEQIDLIDRLEVGRPVSPTLRVAFEVTDAEGRYTSAPPQLPSSSNSHRTAAPPRHRPRHHGGQAP